MALCSAVSTSVSSAFLINADWIKRLLIHDYYAIGYSTDHKKFKQGALN
jgi:hypothetical protein